MRENCGDVGCAAAGAVVPLAQGVGRERVGQRGERLLERRELQLSPFDARRFGLRDERAEERPRASVRVPGLDRQPGGVAGVGVPAPSGLDQPVSAVQDVTGVRVGVDVPPIGARNDERDRNDPPGFTSVGAEASAVATSGLS
jgi:hypothetical protein